LVHEYVVLDVFTRVPLQGNPLAVFTNGDAIEPELMQRTARELNLSETVFLCSGDAGTDARLRIFTPSDELPFAGHPTLGSAFLVGERTGKSELALATGAGVVEVRLTREGESIVYGEMEQPPPRIRSFVAVPELLRALGVKRSELPITAYRNGPLHIFVALSDPDEVAQLAPDMNALSALGPLGVGVLAMAGDHVVTRNFAPGRGVPEDPATGSAAGPLALHLARHEWIAWGQEIEIRQGAEMGRPSLLRARVEGNPDRVDHVVVGGSAVIVAEGRYRLG
jgi:trans-2,3-dihydro-3-hydroxyanthranilate isomerase